MRINKKAIHPPLIEDGGLLARKVKSVLISCIFIIACTIPMRYHIISTTYTKIVADIIDCNRYSINTENYSSSWYAYNILIKYKINKKDKQPVEKYKYIKSIFPIKTQTVIYYNNRDCDDIVRKGETLEIVFILVFLGLFAVKIKK